MRDDRFTLQGTREHSSVVHEEPREVLALVLAWSREEPGRAGEVALVDGPRILGRGGPREEDTLPRAQFQQQRPGKSTLMKPLDSLRVSRTQLRLIPTGNFLLVESIGLCPLLVNGEHVTHAEAKPGDTVQLANEMVFLVARRPAHLLELRSTRRAA